MSRAVSDCRTCGAPMIWVVTKKTGKRMPIDAEPVSRGKWMVEGSIDDKNPVVVFIGSASTYSGDRYASHFETCPNASQHSKKHEDPAPEGACRQDDRGYCATHPSCEMMTIIVETLRANTK